MKQQHSSRPLNIVITGGNSGIGYETMKELYLRGNNIIFGSRNQQRNQEAITNILKDEKESLEKHKAQHFIKSYPLDLSKRKSVEGFANHVKQSYKNIDILINNAGLIMNDLQRNQNNVQMTLAINHFGHFLLTYLLFDILKQSTEARIINVSSLMHYYSPDNILDDIECRDKSFSSNKQYALSKFWNVLFTQELSRKISKYPNIKTVCLHPGIVDSNFGTGVSMFKCFTILCCCLYVNNQEGSRSSVFLSTQDFKKLRNGQYYHSDTQHRQMDQRARDPKLGENLWKMSQDLYEIKFAC